MSNLDLKTPTLTERQEFENNMNPVDIQNENFYVLPKKTKMELDIKTKFEAGIQIKIEPIEDFNRGMEIINDMNVPANNGKIKTENIDAPSKKPKIEMEFKPKIETDFQAKSEPIDDINRGMEIIGNMKNIPMKKDSQYLYHTKGHFKNQLADSKKQTVKQIPIKPKVQAENLENYKCSVCKLVEFPAKNLLIRHMFDDHQKELWQKQQCSKCYEIFGKKSVNEKIKHIVNAHVEKYQRLPYQHENNIVCHICKKKFSEKSLGYHMASIHKIWGYRHSTLSLTQFYGTHKNRVKYRMTKSALKWGNETFGLTF